MKGAEVGDNRESGNEVEEKGEVLLNENENENENEKKKKRKRCHDHKIALTAR